MLHGDSQFALSRDPYDFHVTPAQSTLDAYYFFRVAVSQDASGVHPLRLPFLPERGLRFALLTQLLRGVYFVWFYPLTLFHALGFCPQ
jgi:hypothetical protein